MTDADDRARTITSPVVLSRWLGFELLRLRTSASLTQRNVADALGCSVAKVSYLESGTRPVSPDELRDVLLDLFAVHREDRSRYLDLAERASRPAWWDEWSEQDLPSADRRYVGLEDGAVRLRGYQPSVIHGLLQTPDYARAVLRVFRLVPEERIARLVALRERRQQAITRATDPLVVHFVVDESAIHRQVGGPKVLRTQLEHIVDLATRQKNITFQVVPFAKGAGAYLGPFTLLDFPWDRDPGLVFVEGIPTSSYVGSREDIYRYSIVFDRLTELALDQDDSVEMLRKFIRQI